MDLIEVITAELDARANNLEERERTIRQYMAEIKKSIELHEASKATATSLADKYITRDGRKVHGSK